MRGTHNIETGYFRGEAGWLYASLHPGIGDKKGVVLMIPPFGEERKCAYRMMVEFAQDFAERGFDTLRFDLSGTGESAGTHREQTLSKWIADIRLALAELVRGSDISNVWVVGARLGGNLAMSTAAQSDIKINGIVLLEPLMKGGDVLRGLIRRKQIKEMMGEGAAGSSEDAIEARWASGETIDFDGFAVNPEMAAGIRSIGLRKDVNIPNVPNLLVCHVGGAKSLTGDWAELAKKLDGGSRRVTAIRQRPFWGQLDYEEAVPVKEEVFRFVTSVMD